MAMFSRCKKAELTDAETGETVTAGVSIGRLDSLMIATPLTCKLDMNDPVEIRFLDSTLGVVTCRCKLTSPLLTPDKRFMVYRCQILEELSREQRREDIKIPLTAQVQVIHPASGKTASGTLRDISASGVYLITPLTAQKGETLTFILQLEGSSIPLTAEILRAELWPKKEGYGYGCRFVRLLPQYETQLRAYIFQEERRQYHEKREKG